MAPTSVRILYVLLAAGTLGAAANAQPSPAASRRATTIRALEALIVTGAPGHATHDEGEWLQRAVDDAISRGDREIERMAIRAASPLTARISRPVSSTDDLPSLEIHAPAVLNVPRPVPYSARIYASLDGQALVEVGQQASGVGGGFRIDTRLGPAAAQAGAHHLRLRAEMLFGDAERPLWTEVRDLPELFYAIYELRGAPGSDARRFVYSPAPVPAGELDPLLPREPFAVWLADVLSARRSSTDPPPDWVSHYCSERTADPGSPHDPTAICSVVYFVAGGRVGQIWFRTGDVQIFEDRFTWVPQSPPRVEAIVLGESSAKHSRLSILPSLLDIDPALRPTGDVAIAPDDIAVSPSIPKPGVPAKAVVTVHNRGQDDLRKVLVRIIYATSPTDRGTARNFVVDIPAWSSTDITLDVVFPRSYGFVIAHALQLTEHAPRAAAVPDPTPEDACAFRVLNLRAAPPRYLSSLGDMTGCPGKQAPEH